MAVVGRSGRSNFNGWGNCILHQGSNYIYGDLQALDANKLGADISLVV